ncbi:uncharacterized protein LOC141680887 [Apium graveolens]|uniref:uncharacterized protein LOC141680887 n=1 Tax=Apium graveolens TaxID=4045 RepID=UPI003D78EB77
MTTPGRFTFTDMQNPLFIHLSDGPLSISVSKLRGAGDYRSWKRSLEIQLSSKRKLGFVQGTVKQKRFMLSNGSRKYKLNRDLFALKQNRSKINDYYTTLSSLWEEIDSMNTHPPVTTVADDVKAFIKSLESQKAESRLFQFLNGLDDCYSALRSQLLMMQPLPTVEVAYASIQQEES